MQRRATALILIAIVLVWAIPARSYTIEYSDPSTRIQLKWPSTTITVALSTSLNSPPSNIKAGSDVVGAANRALARWSQAANIQFVVTSTTAQSVSPSSGSGNLNTGFITVADTPENESLFPNSTLAGRSRIFFNPDTGGITEADVALNPSQQYSTDGTTGTYDLESVFTHEIGHLLGLEHSGVVAATMEPLLGKNGFDGVQMNYARTLADDDRAGIISIYGSPRTQQLGSIAGTVTFAGGGAVYGAHVWAENTVTGKVYAGNVSLQNGAYAINGMPGGQYRVNVEYLDGPITGGLIPAAGGGYSGLANGQPPFHTAEVGTVSVGQTAVKQDISVQGGTPGLNASILGLNGQLSTVGVPISAGQSYTVLVGGEGVDTTDQFTVTSPFITVDPKSVTSLQGAGVPVVSFSIAVAPNAQAGEYSIRVQSTAGEISYIAGGLTIDPGVNSSFNNPIDDPPFFVTQHYQDFLNRAPDQAGLDYWTGQITQCGSDPTCIHNERVDVSNAFFFELEFQQTGAYVYRIYREAFGNSQPFPNPDSTNPTEAQKLPSFAVFARDRALVVGGSNLAQSQLDFANTFVSRPEFLARYPANLNGPAFVDAVLATLKSDLGVDLSGQRDALVTLFNTGGRGAVIYRLADDNVQTNPINNRAFIDAEYNRAFVATQYFGYLRRDADIGGLLFWLGQVNRFPIRDVGIQHAMVCSFLTSAEYQLRFGTQVTHTNAECGP